MFIIACISSLLVKKFENESLSITEKMCDKGRLSKQ